MRRECNQELEQEATEGKRTINASPPTQANNAARAMNGNPNKADAHASTQGITVLWMMVAIVAPILQRCVAKRRNCGKRCNSANKSRKPQKAHSKT